MSAKLIVFPLLISLIIPNEIVGYKGMVMALLESGADVNTLYNAGGTVLHCATWSGRKDTVIALLESGADISGETALHYAT